MDNNEKIIENNNDSFDDAQWFIVTAIGGKEDSIAKTLKEKIHNFDYEPFIKTIRIFKDKLISEDVFKKDDSTLPKSLKNTKTTSWETLPNGNYKRIKTKIVNRFPGYIFICMKMDSEVWYAIRNTPGILGFVGSSGKGAMPIPISIEEYQKIDNVNQEATTSEQIVQTEVVEERKVYETDIKVGNSVEIISGNFVGMNGEVKVIDLTKGQAKIEVEMFGRLTTIDANFDEIKLAI